MALEDGEVYGKEMPQQRSISDREGGRMGRGREGGSEKEKYWNKSKCIRKKNTCFVAWNEWTLSHSMNVAALGTMLMPILYPVITCTTRTQAVPVYSFSLNILPTKWNLMFCEEIIVARWFMPNLIYLSPSKTEDWLHIWLWWWHIPKGACRH